MVTGGQEVKRKMLKSRINDFSTGNESLIQIMPMQIHAKSSVHVAMALAVHSLKIGSY